MHELDKTGLEAAQRAADEAYMASDENAVHDAVVAGISAYLSSTSAGVMEEQTPRVTEAMVEAFRKPGMMVFLDGRNEHGSHVIPSLPMNMEIDGCEGDMPEFAEEIICAAEALGFAVGEHVWTEWFWHRPQIGDEGRVEFDGYWEFVRVNPVVSRTLSLEASRVAPVSQKEAVPVAFQWRMRVAIGDGWGEWCDWREGKKWVTTHEGEAEYEERPLYASPAPAVEPVGIKALDTCQTCQGNGEIVTDWDTYLHGDDDEHATAECPDCNGIGKVSPTPVSAPVGMVEELIREAIDLLKEKKYGNPARSPGHNARLMLEDALAALRSPAVEGK